MQFAYIDAGAGPAGLSVVTPAVGRERPAPGGGVSEGVQMEADQVKMQQRWDEYVAAQLSSGKDSASQAELVSRLEEQLAQPGIADSLCPVLALPVDNAVAPADHLHACLSIQYQLRQACVLHVCPIHKNFSDPDYGAANILLVTI